jgi:septation ring formation regulator EzrA
MSDECPILHSILNNYEGEEGDDASAELAQLHDTIKTLREQQERSDKALADVEKSRMILVNKLCDIRDTLKPHLIAETEWSSCLDGDVRQIFKKHFGG